MKTPFHDKQGNIHFPWQPTSDRVFIYPSPSPGKFQKDGLIEILPLYRDFYHDGTGVVLAVGKGFYTEKGKWESVPSLLKPGIKVYFDKTVPWRQVVHGLDGKEYHIVLCGATDVLCVIEN